MTLKRRYGKKNNNPLTPSGQSPNLRQKEQKSYRRPSIFTKSPFDSVSFKRRIKKLRKSEKERR